MRFAVVLALGDARSSDGGTWIDALGLHQELAELGYRVALIDGVDVEQDLVRVLEEVTREDEVLVHVSGRLVDRGVVRAAGGRSVRLQEVGDILAEHAAASVSLFAELMYGGPEDALIGAEHVSSVVGDIKARARGYAMVAAVRAASAPIQGLALTRLFLRVALAGGRQGSFVSSAVYDSIAGTPESLACAESFTFVRGAADPGLALPLARSSGRNLSAHPLPSFDSEPLPSFDSEPLPSFDSEPLPSFDSEPLPSFDSEPLPSFDSEPLPSFDSEPLPSFDSEALPAAVGSGAHPLSDAPPPAPASRDDERILNERIAHATEDRHWWQVVELRRERLRSTKAGRLRVRELVAIARILQLELNDADGAVEALEEARAIDPMRVGVIQALRRGYEKLGRWEQAFDLIDALTELSPSAIDRVQLRLSQARLALDKLHDHQRAFRLLQAVLENDPAHERALEAFEEVCRLRAEMSRTETSQNAADARVALYDARPPDGLLATDASESESVVPDPRDPHVHASAFAVHWREGRTDAAFLAALALEELGATDVNQQMLVNQFRSVSPIRARCALDASAWELLRAPGSDPPLAALFGRVARIAVATRLEALVARRRLVALDPSTCLDEKSTASVVRSFQWAARVLGVPCPALYVFDDVPGDIAAVRAHQPSTAVGPSVVRGRSAKELAFLAGRHLTYYRPEHQVLVYFPTSADLTRLLMATIEVGAPGTSPGARDPAVAALRDRLARRMTKAERTAIAGAVSALEGSADLGTWARSVELTAGRAGLLLCGDLATAAALVRSESRAIAELSPEDRRYDLIEFCSSPKHTELRARFAVTAPETLQPPPTNVHAPTDLAEPSA